MGYLVGALLMLVTGLFIWLASDNYDRRETADIGKCVELKIGTRPQCEFLLKKFSR